MAEVESGRAKQENEGALQGGAPVDAGETPEIVELRKKCEELEQTASQLRDHHTDTMTCRLRRAFSCWKGDATRVDDLSQRL